MREVLLVFLGGGLGSLARYLVSKLYGSEQSFPLGTLTANFLSCVVFGLVISLGSARLISNPALKLLMITGFCGGFSTYSSFTFETVELFKNGNNLLGLSNILLNFFLSIIGLYLGIMLSKIL